MREWLWIWRWDDLGGVGKVETTVIKIYFASILNKNN